MLSLFPFMTEEEPGPQLLEQKLLHLFMLSTFAWSSWSCLIHLTLVKLEKIYSPVDFALWRLPQRCVEKLKDPSSGWIPLRQQFPPPGGLGSSSCCLNGLHTPPRSHMDHLHWPSSFMLYSARQLLCFRPDAAFKFQSALCTSARACWEIWPRLKVLSPTITLKYPIPIIVYSTIFSLIM